MREYDASEIEALANNVTTHKDIVIFHVTAPSSEYDAWTNTLAIRMEKIAKQHHMDVKVRMDSASKWKTRGEEADIILLTPELFHMAQEVKQALPTKVVKVISNEDYGFIDAASVLKLALS